MKRNLLEIYALAVCFFTVACFVIVLGIAVWDGVSVLAPEFTLSNHNWERHQTDEAFRKSLSNENRYREDKDSYKPPEGAALTDARIQSYDQALRAERRIGFQGLARNAIILLLNIALFAIHWKLAARARKNAS
ncbi:MAG: hypothetical protein M0R77_11770 [Gammaproteobacteria bacterium]|nr:hypothetical protein [Gammaproteobacteria bacterium]